MQIRRLPPANMSRLVQIRKIAAMEYLHHEVGVDYISEVSIVRRIERTSNSSHTGLVDT